ncbi:NADP(H)-dependent aldo-keto reductase [Candidatus Macondimonas diazotrophica]|jgi:aryl-alcohol dehydrogenase-like predicted oxidoreductase|nr:NADP(H)-dependent aldo-keto reductase [Candidatus Macondimonas diazotrophica]
MDYRPLGRTPLTTSLIGLGTMTWGEQNSEVEAHAQIAQALDAGVNLIDAAEMYPVPPRAETQGRTETILGNWLARNRSRRDDLIIATKVSGRADWLPWIRDGQTRLTRGQITAALDASLGRLQTDYIDLYQLHWPDRETNFFGRLGYERSESEAATTPLLETLSTLDDLVRAGKIRQIGVSNETPWGLMRFLEISERLGLTRMASIQNPYNLLNRTFEVGLAEIAHREDVPLLAYSPLAFGVLSGKYLDGARPPAGRLTRFERFQRYTNPQAEAATAAYVELARSHGLEPAQMALAYVLSRPFVSSALIGATTTAQLASNLAASEIRLPDALIAEIEAIHREHPNPAP